jgi:hypothetical protein
MNLYAPDAIFVSQKKAFFTPTILSLYLLHIAWIFLQEIWLRAPRHPRMKPPHRRYSIDTTLHFRRYIKTDYMEMSFQMWLKNGIYQMSLS